MLELDGQNGSLYAASSSSDILVPHEHAEHLLTLQEARRHCYVNSKKL